MEDREKEWLVKDIYSELMKSVMKDLVNGDAVQEVLMKGKYFQKISIVGVDGETEEDALGIKIFWKPKTGDVDEQSREETRETI